MAVTPTLSESLTSVIHSSLPVPLVSISVDAPSLEDLWPRVQSLVKDYSPWLAFFAFAFTVVGLFLSACRAASVCKICRVCMCSGTDMCLSDTENSDPATDLGHQAQHPVVVVVNNYRSDNALGGDVELAERSIRSPFTAMV